MLIYLRHHVVLKTHYHQGKVVSCMGSSFHSYSMGRADHQCLQHRKLLHLRLDIFKQLLQFFFAWTLLRPADAQAFLLIRLRYHVHVDVVNFLMRGAPVILQYVVILRASSSGNLCSDRKQLR